MTPIDAVVLGAPAFLFSLVFLDCAHASVGHAPRGDTARLLGRLTLNPAPPIDPNGTVDLPLIGVPGGALLFGRPTPVRLSPFRPLHPLGDGALISAAGATVDAVLGLALALGPFRAASWGTADPVLEAERAEIATISPACIRRRVWDLGSRRIRGTPGASRGRWHGRKE